MTESPRSALTEIVGTPREAKQEIENKKERDKRAREKQERISRAEKDFAFFCTTYLPHYFYDEPAGYQKVLIDILNTRKVTLEECEYLRGLIKQQYHQFFGPRDYLKAIVDAEPREHGKTVRAGFAYPLYCALFKKYRFTLLIGASATAAEENLENIKTELEENDLILADFGELKGETWKTEKIELTNGTCIMARGAGASMRGVRYRENRPDLVIMDDIMKDDSADSKVQRDKLFRWCKRVVLPLGRKIFLVWINTIFHDDDLVVRLLKEIKAGDHPDWIGLRFSCWVKDQPDNGPLWPGGWSSEALLSKQSDMGSGAFSTEYRNEPLTDEERKFKPYWFQYFPEDMPTEGLKFYAANDPATGAHDLSTDVEIGVDHRGIIYVWDAWGERCDETKYVGLIVMKHLMYRAVKRAFESVAFQKIYKRFIVKEAAALGVYIPIEEITPKGTQKEIRIQKLAPLIETGIIRFHPTRCKQLVEQLVEWPKHTYDDLPDTLAYAVEIAETGKARPTGAACRMRRRAARILERYRS